METHKERWLMDWLPDIHIMFNGATGGWDVFCETSMGLKFKMQFNRFPTVEELNTQAIKEIRRLNGCIE
jgi:hypothetical protein